MFVYGYKREETQKMSPEPNKLSSELFYLNIDLNLLTETFISKKTDQTDKNKIRGGFKDLRAISVGGYFKYNVIATVNHCWARKGRI